MDIKGTAVKSTQDYVKEKYPEKYRTWLGSLSPDIKNDFEYGIFSSNWFNLTNYVLKPTEKVGEVVFEGDTKKSSF